MTALLDSSILVAALSRDEERHRQCLDLLLEGGHFIHAHALLETFATLTGGRLGIRVDADFASRLLRETILPKVQVVEMTVDDILTATAQARKQGVRGGGIYDYMHLMAARKVKATILYTINISDFEAVWRSGDPQVKCP
ncbi:MAG: PIN domain-containing protein [Verrucomicrobiaceae bacterium]